MRLFARMSKTTYKPVFPFLPALALLFIALKLTHVIDWSWFWVLSPLLLIAAAVIIGLGGVGLALAVSAWLSQARPKRLAKILPALLLFSPLYAADRPADHTRYDCRSCHQPQRLCENSPEIISFRKWLESRTQNPVPASPNPAKPSPNPVPAPANSAKPNPNRPIVVRDSGSARKIVERLEKEQWDNVEKIFAK